MSHRNDRAPSQDSADRNDMAHMLAYASSLSDALREANGMIAELTARIDLLVRDRDAWRALAEHSHPGKGKGA